LQHEIRTLASTWQIAPIVAALGDLWQSHHNGGY
jgi:hypothetical protein